MRWIRILIPLLLWQAGLCQQAGPLLVVRQNKLCGLIDTTGQVVLPAMYDEIKPNLAFNLYLVHGSLGEAVFAAKSNNLITAFYDRIELVGESRFIVTRNNLSGVADDKGSILIPVSYINIFRASNGKFISSSGERITIFSRDGIAETSIVATEIKEIRGYLIFRSEDNLYGLTDGGGNIITPAEFTEFSENNGIIELRNSDSLIIFHTGYNRLVRYSNKVQVKFISDGLIPTDASPFYSAKTATGSKKWYSIFTDIALTVDLTDAFVYESRLKGYFVVNTGYMWLVDSLGNQKLDDKYESLSYFKGQQFVVQKSELKGIVDLDSGMVLEMAYRNIYLLADTIVDKKWIWAVNDEGARLMDNQFRIVNKGVFVFFQLVQGRGIIGGKSFTEWMLFDTNGNKVCDPLYSNIAALPGGLWRVFRDGGWGIMSAAGRELTEMKYDEITVGNIKVKCTFGNEVDFYRWNGTTLEPLVNYSNYRRLDIAGTQMLSLAPLMNGSGIFVWVRDSVMQKFGLMNTRIKQYSIPPTYDYVRYDPIRDISLTGIMGDTSCFTIGPLKFIGRLRFGVVDQTTSRIIAPNEYMFLYFNSFFDHYIDGDKNKITPFYNSDRNVTIGIDTTGKYRTLSYTGLSLSPDVEYISELRSSARAWRFDSCYVAEKKAAKTDARICSVSGLYTQISAFLRPMDEFTQSAVKSGRLNIYAVKPDSMQFQRGAGERRDPGFDKIINRSLTPMFVKKYSYVDLIERRGNAYCNMKTFTKQKRFSYIDSTGFAISDPVFIKALPFSEGLAVVKSGAKYGYINKEGTIVIENKFRKAASFSEGMAAVLEKGGKYGYINCNGDWVIEPAYREALAFREGLAPVKPANLFGYINESGTMVIQPSWLRANPFYNGTAVVYNKNGFGLIDQGGKRLLRCRYSRITPPDSNRIRFVSKGLMTFLVNEKGESVTKKSKSIVNAGDGYYSIKKGLKYVLVRSDGSVVAGFDADRPLVVGDDRVLVTRRNKFYYYDMAGRKLLGPYVKAAEFHLGCAVVSDQLEAYIIDKDGKKLYSAGRSRLSATGSFDDNGIAVIRRGSVFMLIDTAGHVRTRTMERPVYAGGHMYILKDDGAYLFNVQTGVSYNFSKWSEIALPSEGYFTVTSNGLYGVMDIFGRYDTNPQFTCIERVRQGIYRVSYGDKTGYMQFDGTIIWEPSR